MGDLRVICPLVTHKLVTSMGWTGYKISGPVNFYILAIARAYTCNS